MNAFDRIGQTCSHMLSLYNTWAKSKGISYPTLAVLHTLIKEESCTQKHICTQWGLPKQTVSAACRELHRQHMIAFLPSSSDQREKMLALSLSGRQYALPLISELNDLEAQAINTFGEKRAQRFAGEMAEFVTALERVMLYAVQ